MKNQEEKRPDSLQAEHDKMEEGARKRGELRKEDEKESKQEIEETKKKASPTYLIRAFKENIRKFEELKMLDAEDLKTLKETHKKIVLRFIGGDLDL